MSEIYPKAAEAAIAHTLTDLLSARIRLARQLTPEQRVLAGIEHSELALGVVRDGIRDQFPAADQATVEGMLRERIELMKTLERRAGANK
jgi:hypothetical protein